MAHRGPNLKQYFKTRRPLVIGVAGGSCSGKTMVSQLIYNSLQDKSIMILHQDSYYKENSSMSMAQRVKINYDHPLAFDNDLLYQQLKLLLQRKAVNVPIYDYVTHNRKREAHHQEPRDIIILEGILTLYDKKIRDLMDIKVFVDADDDIRFIRRLRRDVKTRGRSINSIITQYLASVGPMFHQFIEPTKRYADVIIPEGGHNQVAIDLLTTKISAILRSLKIYRQKRD